LQTGCKEIKQQNKNLNAGTMKNANTYEPSSISIYMQRALRPISRKFYYTDYANALPLKEKDRVLEFGSGVGTMAKILANRLGKGQITCVDISRRYLSATKRHLKDYPNTSFYEGRLVNLDLKENSFDMINVHLVLHDVLVENRKSLVEEMFTLLRPGGKLYIREPLKASHGMPVTEIKSLFENAGFYPTFEKEGHSRTFGDVFTACYTKLSTIQFFFS
jgi:ubiquinone/menaquinone biosynthesis C-methylase UbiE